MILDSLSKYDLTEKNIYSLSEDIYIVHKELWDYQLCLEFQKDTVEFIRENKNVSVFILTSHPSCFTMGRGLQKNTKSESLVEFDKDLNKGMKYPVYNIGRGGGLTFHHPGQVVFYPIYSLSFHKAKVYDFIGKVLRASAKSLELNFDLKNLNTEHHLLGLWMDQLKLGSIGLQITRYITWHGYALNLFHDEDMMNELKTLFPCGISPEKYTSVERILDREFSAEDKKQYITTFLKEFISETFDLRTANSLKSSSLSL